MKLAGFRQGLINRATGGGVLYQFNKEENDSLLVESLVKNGVKSSFVDSSVSRGCDCYIR